MRVSGKYAIGIFFMIAFGATLTAGGQKESSSDLLVVGSTSIVSDVVKNVAGDKIHMVSLMGPSQDPHAYEPTPKDMATVENADLLFLNGYDLEEGLVPVLETVGTGHLVELSRHGRMLEHDEADEHDEHHDGEDHHDGDGDEHDEHEHHHHGGIDPHTWMSPLNVIEWVDIIRDALSEADPKDADYFADNAAEYTEKLLSLHQEIQDTLKSIPLEERILVTDHDAFGYYAEEYGLEIVGTIIPSASTSSDASARHLAELIHTIEEHDVKAIFIGQTTGDDIKQLSEAIKNELGHPVAILPLLTGAIQKPGEPGDSYLEYMRYNTKQIVSGLSSD